jgi:hypothetical protein
MSNKVREQDFRDISSVKLMQVGAYDETIDGRGYRYALAGGTTLAPGKLGVAATADSNATNKTIARTVAAGETQVVFDAGGTIVANVYQDGYLTINDATGEGITYLVANHTGVTGAGEITVNLAEPIKVGLTIDVSEGTLCQNPWSGVVISVADQLDMPAGVPNVSITNAYYGWVQTKGACAVLADETLAVGENLTIGSSTVGAVEENDGVGEANVGTAIEAGVDTEYHLVYLQID